MIISKRQEKILKKFENAVERNDDLKADLYINLISPFADIRKKFRQLRRRFSLEFKYLFKKIKL